MNINTLSSGETAAAFLPPSLFQSITRRNVGIFFAVYDVGVLFPIMNATQINQETNDSVTAVVGSPILATTVGPGLNFSGLEEPVSIFLRLNDLGVSDRKALCWIEIIRLMFQLHYCRMKQVDGLDVSLGILILKVCALSIGYSYCCHNYHFPTNLCYL